MTTEETPPLIHRVYLVIAPGEEGRMQMRLSRTSPDCEGAVAVLICKGELLTGESVTVDLS